MKKRVKGCVNKTTILQCIKVLASAVDLLLEEAEVRGEGLHDVPGARPRVAAPVEAHALWAALPLGNPLQSLLAGQHGTHLSCAARNEWISMTECVFQCNQIMKSCTNRVE